MSWRLSPHRRTDPARVLLRSALLLCGFALTWSCAAFGLLLLSGPDTCRLPRPSHKARAQVHELERDIFLFQIEHDRCPKSSADLIAGGYADAPDLVDPWGTPIDVRCTDEDVAARSAGPDRGFGTGDDVSNP